MLSSQTPFKIPRIVSLALLAATAIAATGLAINGLVKFDEVKSAAKREAPAGVDVDIVTGNFVPVGIVVSAACGKLTLVALSLLFAKPLATRFLQYQAILFALLSMFLLAVVIPFTDFLVNRSAAYSVTANGVPVPANIVKAVVGSKTSELEYRRHVPLRAAVVVAWMVLPFSVACSVLSFMAHRALTAAPPPKEYDSRRDSASSTEKV